MAFPKTSSGSRPDARRSLAGRARPVGRAGARGWRPPGVARRRPDVMAMVVRAYEARDWEAIRRPAAPLSAGSGRGTAWCAPARARRRSGDGGPCSTIDALVHEHHPVGDVPCEAHLVGHAQHRHARPCQLLHHVQDLADHLRVERGRRLVEQHDPRLHRERPCDRDPLLLTARQLERVLGGLLGDAHALEQLACLAPLRAPASSHAPGSAPA